MIGQYSRRLSEISDPDKPPETMAMIHNLQSKLDDDYKDDLVRSPLRRKGNMSSLVQNKYKRDDMKGQRKSMNIKKSTITVGSVSVMSMAGQSILSTTMTQS